MNGKVEKFASLVSCDVLIVEVANEYVFPFEPTPRKPDESEPRFSVPMLATVADAYEKEPRVVEEFVKI